ncbi:hypothetical protein HJC23_004141 [Cyclotella cryptica]|uniref:Uncharacterized protein n=1 Tax=Cyclotella cryptica TaxID=29204 RepID=A0ABD3PH35_9STRA
MAREIVSRLKSVLGLALGKNISAIGNRLATSHLSPPSRPSVTTKTIKETTRTIIAPLFIVSNNHNNHYPPSNHPLHQIRMTHRTSIGPTSSSRQNPLPNTGGARTIGIRIQIVSGGVRIKLMIC